MNRQILIYVKEQRLDLLEHEQVIKSYQVSTAKNGTGELIGSECTPRGKHCIKLKIGENCPVNSVFVGRRPTGEIYSERLQAESPERDWILSRIIWLEGLEKNINRGGQCDTLKRYIYIHGTPDSEIMGIPNSHGCIRMKNKDIIELFDMVYNHMQVTIIE